MLLRSFNLAIKKFFLVIDINKDITNVIKKNYGFTNNQFLMLCWLKGLWTGVLVSLVIHHMISH